MNQIIIIEMTVYFFCYSASEKLFFLIRLRTIHVFPYSYVKLLASKDFFYWRKDLLTKKKMHFSFFPISFRYIELNNKDIFSTESNSLRSLYLFYYFLHFFFIFLRSKKVSIRSDFNIGIDRLQYLAKLKSHKRKAEVVYSINHNELMRSTTHFI